MLGDSHNPICVHTSCRERFRCIHSKKTIRTLHVQRVSYKGWNFTQHSKNLNTSKKNKIQIFSSKFNHQVMGISLMFKFPQTPSNHKNNYKVQLSSFQSNNCFKVTKISVKAVSPCSLIVKF